MKSLCSLPTHAAVRGHRIPSQSDGGCYSRSQRCHHLSPEMPPGTSSPSAEAWTWENAAAGAAAGFATVAALHPLDVVRTRFQGNRPPKSRTVDPSAAEARSNDQWPWPSRRAVTGGRGWSEVPPYKNTAHAVYTISRSEVLSPATFCFCDWLMDPLKLKWSYVAYNCTSAKFRAVSVCGVKVGDWLRKCWKCTCLLI
jgi:hypothetical protein